MNSLRAHAEQQFKIYLQLFPAEQERLDALAHQFMADSEDIFSRSNMRGHITTSALVMDRQVGKVLTVHHRQFNRWLPPGGHYEGTDGLSESALREAIEETGIKTADLHFWHHDNGAPLDIDIHKIGARPLKQEGEHVHHDFMYAFIGNSEHPLAAQLSEVFDARWIGIDDFIAMPGIRFKRLAEKLILLKA